MRSLVVLVPILAVSAVLVSTAPGAVPPSSPAPVVVGHAAFTVEFPGDTNTCGFPLDEVVHVRSSFRAFETPDGPFANIFHAEVRFSFTANGRTVLVAQHQTQRFPVLEPELRETGLTVHIRLAGGGLVVRDAGLFVLGFDGSVDLVRGPHPILEAGGESAAVAAICEELAA